MASPPIGYYFCLPRLTSGRQLINSNIVPLQPEIIYQQDNTRPCLPTEFQNTSRPSCAVPGVTVDPSQILMPVAPTVIDTLQFIRPTAVDLVTPTALLEVQQTPVAAREPAQDNNLTIGLIVGVTVGTVVLVIIIALTVILGIVILCQGRRNNKISGTEDSKRISISKFRINGSICMVGLTLYPGLFLICAHCTIMKNSRKACMGMRHVR